MEPSRCRRVLRHIEACGAQGATDDEIEIALGFPHQTASARRRDLVLLGLVRDSGGRRPTRNRCMAQVWVLSAGDTPPKGEGADLPAMADLVAALEVLGVPSDERLGRVCRWLRAIIETLSSDEDEGGRR